MRGFSLGSFSKAPHKFCGRFPSSGESVITLIIVQQPRGKAFAREALSPCRPLDTNEETYCSRPHTPLIHRDKTQCCVKHVSQGDHILTCDHWKLEWDYTSSGYRIYAMSSIDKGDKSKMCSVNESLQSYRGFPVSWGLLNECRKSDIKRSGFNLLG